MEARHETVLLAEAVEQLAVEPGDTVVDATIGGAGHFARLYAALRGEGTLIGIDADAAALKRAQEALAETSDGQHVMLVHDNFRNLEQVLDRENVKEVDAVLFDLGWSAFQLTSGKGFSFQADEPLLMTYGEPGEGESAAAFVNRASEQELADTLFRYGEERFARGIAKSIVAMRKHQSILTTTDLVSAVEQGTPAWYQRRRLHPATKTFQALRIAVNDELGALREGLAAAIDRLSATGRIVVITFHSIEDRIVKHMLRDAAHAGRGTVLTKKPLTPSPEELARNPRARSAKLRVFAAAERSPLAIAMLAVPALSL